MKNLLVLVALIFLGTTVFGQTISVDTEGATVSFNYVSEKTKGTLTGVQAQINIDPSNLTAATISGSVDINTLSTGNKMRDKHLKTDEFFDAEKFPKMSFLATEIIKDGDAYKAIGKLTIKDITKDVTFKVTETDGILIFKTMIYSSDFGVAIKKDRDKSKVYISMKIPVK